mgnify:CR=1 FL=1
MKRMFLCLPVVAMFLVGLIGCSGKREWNHQQRQAMRQALREYRDMVYLNDLTDAEYLIFTDEVATDLETAYPVYTTFIEMPGVEDTVDMVIVETIVDYLNADRHNMRHLFPCNDLVAEGVLPAGLNLKQRREFYTCLAGKVNGAFLTLYDFVVALEADTTVTSQIAQMEADCADELFDWVITEVDIIETN